MRRRIFPTTLLAALGLFAGCSDDSTGPGPLTDARTPRAAIAAGPSCPAGGFDLVDLGPGVAEDINDHGAIAGESGGQAVLWTATTRTRQSLAALGGGPSHAFGINGRGDVVGSSAGRPVLWPAAGGIQPLATTQEVFESGAAIAINDNGVMVGTQVSSSIERSEAVFWTAPQQPGVLAARFDIDVANDVNGQNQSVGFASGGGASESFIWTIGGGTVDLYRQLCCSADGGSPNSAARGINELGQVVGEAVLAPYGAATHAFLWSPTAGTTDLGTLGGALDFSSAAEINDQAQVVGYSTIDPGQFGAAHAFLWTAATGMQDLGVLPGAQTSHAHSINNVGQIVGESDGHAVLWSPASATPAARVATLDARVAALAAAGTLRPADATALHATLAAAAKALAHVPPTPAPQNLLNAFVRQVEALVRSGRLPNADGQGLISAARCVLA